MATDDPGIIALLTECFPAVEQFRTHDWWNEVPRWRVRIEDEGRVVAYCSGIYRIIEAYTQGVGATPESFSVLGVGQVAVTESHRHRGHVRQMLDSLHVLGAECDFSVLMTNSPWVYETSGYEQIANIEWGMVRSLQRDDWPNGPIDLKGPGW